MRLKSLKLAGFKSFATATTFHFRHGITAIVGPNGCGKSNVIDAIRWVLGETSAKQLRGGAMSDVIFAGTQDKSAKSVASVELTFEHTQDEHTGIRHELNLYQELSVRRQVNLEGRSEYFINGTRCRRRDVVDVFLGTGLGARSYAVIEQGMIGRIVDSSPLQLREFVEEAAGVSRYQLRRAETQKKLETTQDNLARLHDMQSELLRQQKTLKKQAASAQDYEALTLAHADIEQQLAIQQLYQAKHEQQQHSRAQVHHADAVAAHQQHYDHLKAKQAQLGAHIDQEQWLKDEAQRDLYQHQLACQHAEHALSAAQAQIDELTQQIAAVREQREQLRDDNARLTTEQSHQQRVLKDLQAELSTLADKRAAQHRDDDPVDQAWQAAQDELARLEDEARQLAQQDAINTQAQTRHQHSEDKLQRRQQQWQTRYQQLQDTLADAATAIGAESTSLSDANDDIGVYTQALEHHMATLTASVEDNARQQENVAARQSELQPQVQEREQQLHAAQQALSEAEKHHAVLTSEYDTLHAIVHPKPVEQRAATDHPDTAAPHTDTTAAPHQQGDQEDDSEYKASQLNDLPLTTLRAQIELTTLGAQHAEALDRVLSLWLDSHILKRDPIAPAHTGDVNDKDVNARDGNAEAVNGDDLSSTGLETTDSEAPKLQAPKLQAPKLQAIYDNSDTRHTAAGDGDSLWHELDRDLASILSYQAASDQAAASQDESHSDQTGGHSLWVSATPRTSSVGTETSAAAGSSYTLLPLTQLIASPQLALWQQCYLYLDHKTLDQHTLQPMHQPMHQPMPDEVLGRHTLANLRAITQTLPATALVLTTSGWLISRYGTLSLNRVLGAATGDDQAQRQFLAQRVAQRARLAWLETQLDAYPAQIDAHNTQVAQYQRDVHAIATSLTETQAQAEQLIREGYQYQQQLTSVRAQTERIFADSARLETERVALEQERQELEQERHSLADTRDHIQRELAALTPRIEEARSRCETLQVQRQARRRERDADDKAYQALQLSVQQSEIRLEHSSASLTALCAQDERAQASEQQLQAKLASAHDQLPDKQALVHAAQQQRDEHQALLTDREATLTQLKDSHHEQQAALDAEHRSLQEAQQQLATVDTELALSTARLTDASEQLQQRLTAYDRLHQQYHPDEASTTPTQSVSNILADFIAHDRRVRPDKIAALTAERATLKQQLDKLGAVNLAAAAELAEINERLEPLTQQIEDIEASIETLRDAIASIDETTKTVFMQTLAAINEALGSLFAKVFGGGRASLTLNTDQMPADIPTARHQAEQWRAGLTLMAQPKGKRNSRLAVLSGGEKTLTALSLVFAIFKQHPAPFCVLDEVDAPLDDANVARFTNLIQDLASDVQFIFISHNKLSMQIADELKGITMPQAGVSTLVSVSLDEAMAYIEA